MEGRKDRLNPINASEHREISTLTLQSKDGSTCVERQYAEVQGGLADIWQSLLT